MSELYIVHCIDTEGPLYESLPATFDRMQAILGIDIAPTRENLERIQRGEVDLGGKEKAAQMIFSPELLAYNDTWGKIDGMLDTMLSSEYRLQFSDSAGNGWIYSWFILDHIDFLVNPRRRDIGYHNIFDHYCERLRQGESSRDEVHWHFHPMSTYREAHTCGTSLLRSPHVIETLARRVIDRCWFPTSYRAGFHAERPDIHWFLEQWIPFDFSNQAMSGLTTDGYQRDTSNGRFGDWRRAVDDWSHYHPSHDDYQVPGDCRRTIFRCLNVGTRLRLLTQEDVTAAFSRAADGHPTMLAFTNHDFRDMRSDVAKTYAMIAQSAKEHPEVSWYHLGAKEAAQRILGIDSKRDQPTVDVCIDAVEGGAVVSVKVSEKLFGPQPFLAIKTQDNRYLTDNFDLQVPGLSWTYTFDSQTIPIHAVESIGVATTFMDGACSVIVLDKSGQVIQAEFFI